MSPLYPPGRPLGIDRQTLPLRRPGLPLTPTLARAFRAGETSPCPTEQGHGGAGAIALPRDRSAAVTRTVGPEQRSVRWAVAALRLE